LNQRQIRLNDILTFQHICGLKRMRSKDDRWSVGYSSIVRIELKDGATHEDVGFAASDNAKKLGDAIEIAKKVGIIYIFCAVLV
jgi:recombination DNA repair RAD52 pathway protein